MKMRSPDRKLLLMLLVAALCVALTGCGNTGEQAPNVGGIQPEGEPLDVIAAMKNVSERDFTYHYPGKVSGSALAQTLNAAVSRQIEEARQRKDSVTNTTEEEFDALVAQYLHQTAAMELNIVPLHPDAVDPFSIPRPEYELKSIPIGYPEAYQDAPEGYKPVLDGLLQLSERLGLEEYGTGRDLDIVGFTEYPYPSDGELGYALTDLNGDGVLELLLGTIDGLKSAAPNSIFTLKNEEPVLLISFWSRSRGAVSADGIIYGDGSGGAAYTYLSSFRLEQNADALTQLTDIRSDYSASAGKPYYFQLIERKKHYISEQEFYGFCGLYTNPPERMELTVLAIVP